MKELIYGQNVINAAIEAKRKIYKLYIQDNFKSKYEDILKHNFDVEFISKYDMDKSFKGLHQGLVAEVEAYTYVELDSFLKEVKNPVIFILDGLEDPHNLGAILRTADATNVDLIIIPKHRSVSLNGTVAKVSTGAIEYVKVAQVTNINQTIQKLKKHDIWVYGTDMSGTSKYNEISYDGGVAIVIGSEGYGMSELVKKNCDLLLNIPMNGKVNSLNASVSAALLMYEVFNKRSNS